MPPENRTVIEATAQSNLPQSICDRVTAGRIPWSGPLVLIVARSVFLVAAQALLALVFRARGDVTPWTSSGQWWTVYATLADFGCLALLWRYTRIEGVSVLSLFGRARLRFGFDVWFGLALCVLIFPLIAVGGMFANWLAYGSFIASTAPSAGAAAVAPHVFPVWRTIYSVAVWWMIWTPTEQLTYQGFALPRLQALTGRTWVAMLLVGFWWSLQHCFIPFVPDRRNVVARFVMVVPGLAAMMLVYLRTRRLAPLIIAQWPMDILVAIMTTTTLMNR